MSTVVGHSRQIHRIKSLISSTAFPCSSLFVGPEGVGKKLIAVEVLSLLTGSPMNVRVLGTEYPAGIDDVRSVVSWLFTKPTTGKGKGVVVDNADEMRGESASALLKTLEEPPRYAYIVLVARSEHAVLPTIRSRCRVFRFGRLSDTNVEFILEKAGVIAPPDVVKLANGSAGMAMRLSGSLVPELVREFEEVLKSRSASALFDFSARFSRLSRDDALLFLNALENLLFQKGAKPKWHEAISRAREYLRFHGKPQSVVEWLLIDAVA